MPDARGIVWDDEVATVSIPDARGIVWDEEAEPVAAKPKAVPEKRGVLGRTLDRLQLGLSDAMSTTQGETYGRSGDPTQRDNLNAASKFVKTLGGDVIPAIGEAGMDLAIGTAQNVAPEASAYAGEKIGEAVTAIADTAPAQAVGEGLDKWKAASPESYALAGELGNIAATAVPVAKLKLPSAARNKAVLEKTLAKQKRGDLVSRFEPANPYDQGTLEIVDNLSGTKEFIPNKRYAGVIDEIEKTPGVRANRSHTENIKALETEVNKVRKSLDTKLESANKITGQELDDELLSAMTRASESPMLVGDAGKSAERIYDAFNKMYVDKLDDAGNISAKDLLDVRRQLDNLLEDSMKDPFSPGGSAAKVATRELRQAINNTVARAAPDGGVKEDLARMNKMLEGRDTLLPKSVNEGNNRMSRAIERLEERTGFRHPVSPLAFQANVMNPLVLTATLATAGGRGLKNTLSKISVGGDKVVSDALKAATTDAQKAAIIAAANKEELPIE